MLPRKTQKVEYLYSQPRCSTIRQWYTLHTLYHLTACPRCGIRDSLLLHPFFLAPPLLLSLNGLSLILAFLLSSSTCHDKNVHTAKGKMRGSQCVTIINSAYLVSRSTLQCNTIPGVAYYYYYCRAISSTTMSSYVDEARGKFHTHCMILVCPIIEHPPELRVSIVFNSIDIDIDIY